MFGLTKKIFMGLLISIVNASNHTKCVSLKLVSAIFYQIFVFSPNDSS